MTILTLRKDKIKSLECIKPMRSCKHLWTASMFGDRYIPYYCEVKKKQIRFPGGTRECKYFK